jgi:hypothetical protein
MFQTNSLLKAKKMADDFSLAAQCGLLQTLIGGFGFGGKQCRD